MVPSGGAERSGSVFWTRLSQEPSCIDVQTLRSYIDSQCEKMGKAPIIETMGSIVRLVSETPNSILLPVTKRKFGETYDSVRDFVMRADCREVCCMQLSDQLAYCRKCSARPILYNILKNQNAMRTHLNEHDENSDAKKLMNELLLSAVNK